MLKFLNITYNKTDVVYIKVQSKQNEFNKILYINENKLTKINGVVKVKLFIIILKIQYHTKIIQINFI